MENAQSTAQSHRGQEAETVIRRRVAADVLYYASHPEKIEQRLSALDCEWNLERVLAAGAGWTILGGFLFGMFSRKWRLASYAAAGLLLQHAYRGWCPPGEALRKLGIRTAREIDQERCALKALRGDFGDTKADSPDQAFAKADKALRASGLIG